MTHILQQPDYSDYVRNVRESAAVLDRIARNNVIRRDELLGVASFLQSTAMSLADRLDPGQDQEPRVVDHEGKVLLAQLPCPSDEGVARGELPRGGGEAEHGRVRS